MSQDERYAHGEFCWTDLASRNPGAAKRFYAALFGWDCVDQPAPGGSIYTLCRLDGANVGGLYAMPPEQSDWVWSAYVAVADCDRAVADATRLGGAVRLPVMDIEGVGRMAVITDPDGAALSLWQADSPHCGFARLGLGPRPGTVVWNELAARSPEAAKAFYQGLFGWGVKETAMPGFTYVEWLIGDRSAGGMLPLAAIGANVPPHWLVYFACADCDASAARAAELGGRVLRVPFDVPGVGRIAVLADAEGAVFAVIALAIGAA